MRHALLILALLAGACGRPEAAAPSGPAAIRELFKFEDASGKLLLTLAPYDNGYKASGPDGAFVAKLRVKGDRVKVKDAKDRETAKLKTKPDGLEIEDGAGTRLFKITKDGLDFKLKGAADTTLLKAKSKEAGYELRDGAGATIAKVKAHEGKVVFKKEDGTLLYEAKGLKEARAGMWLAAERLPLDLRAALVVYFLEVSR